MRLALLAIGLCSYLWAEQKTAGEWHFRKDDPQTKKEVLTIDAKSFEATKDAHVFRLHQMVARVYQAGGSSFKEVKSESALFDERSATLHYGPQMKATMRLNQLGSFR
jgi:hypothetical protein